MTAATTFIHSLFGFTTESVYFCSFPNERFDETEPPERHVATRISSHITAFAAKWDRAKRGLFFCVGTVKHGQRRAKENIVETIGLHVDIDFKNISDSRSEVEHKLTRLKHPPSAVVFSGGGLHCYWLFKEAFDTQSDIERIESALRQLTDLVGGDLQCCEVSRVLRLPGSHNTKDNGWIEVEVLSCTEARFELDDLEEWLSEVSPVILRVDRPHAVTAGEITDNPYLKYAAEHGFKPPLDVEKRLAAMMYMGGGDASIHLTQIAVSASLLNSGMPLDEVVPFVLQATRAAAGDYGSRWNWKREERTIRRDCEKWLAKHPVTKTVAAPRDISAPLGKIVDEQQEAQRASSGGAKIIQMTKPAPAPKPPKKEQEHVVLGNIVLNMMRDTDRHLINSRQGTWLYTAGVWTMQTDTKWLDVQIEFACVTTVETFKSRNKLIAETRNWIMRQPELWREDIPWDAHGKIPTRSGLIDPDTLALTPAKPDDFCSWRIECDYDPTAKCPWWLVMVNDLFADREPVICAEHVRVLQELLGAALIDVKPRPLSKAAIFWGGSNCGKSGALDVMSGLFGADQIVTPLEALDSTHGLMQFVRRLPWVLHEAFKPGKWHFSSEVKAIITSEPVMINVKNGALLRKVVRSPIFWATNYAPQFKEATKAIVNRIVVLQFLREFREGEPLVGAAAEAAKRGFDKPSTLVLNTELPGLLNWAIAGLRKARQRGSIELTDEIRETADEIRRDSNLVAGFLKDCVEYQHTRRVSVPDFCAAFAVWFTENKGEDRGTPSNESIGRAMVAMSDPKVGINSKELRDKLCRYYVGIVLNNAGHTYWKRAVESNQFQGKTTNTTSSNSPDLVNDLIPESWLEKAAVTAMKKAQKGELSPTVTGPRTVIDGTE